MKINMPKFLYIVYVGGKNYITDKPGNVKHIRARLSLTKENLVEKDILCNFALQKLNGTYDLNFPYPFIDKLNNEDSFIFVNVKKIYFELISNNDDYCKFKNEYKASHINFGIYKVDKQEYMNPRTKTIGKKVIKTKQKNKEIEGKSNLIREFRSNYLILDKNEVLKIIYEHLNTLGEKDIKLNKKRIYVEGC